MEFYFSTFNKRHDSINNEIAIMKIAITIFFSFLAVICMAQGIYTLQMDFDGCTIMDQSGLNVPINTIGSPTCVCSPNGDAFAFDGSGDALTMQDTNLLFELAFTISIVFRPDGNLDNQRMVSYKQACNSPQGFDITYDRSTNSVTFELYESIGRRIFFEQALDDRQCWHAMTFVKTGSSYLVFLYGEQVFQTTAASSFDVGVNGILTLGSGPCVPGIANAFTGAIDYFSTYDDVIPLADILSQVIVTDEIVTPNALIFLGDAITPQVNAECATGFSWSPAAGVSDINVAEPSLGPTESTVYELTIQDGGCQVTDSLRVLVVDPTQVTCEELILPTAFTPNNDGLNDTYFISNGFVVEELIRFEIFDRWGGKLFSTSDVTMAWDGMHKGVTVMPGVYVFKAEYICNGETKVEARSFSVLN